MCAIFDCRLQIADCRFLTERRPAICNQTSPQRAHAQPIAGEQGQYSTSIISTAHRFVMRTAYVSVEIQARSVLRLLRPVSLVVRPSLTKTRFEPITRASRSVRLRACPICSTEGLPTLEERLTRGDLHKSMAAQVKPKHVDTPITTVTPPAAP